MKLFLKVFAVVLSVACGAVFLLSAYTKLFPIEPFEYTFVELGITNWKCSVFIARFFIGFEFACGGLLILNFWLKRFTIPLVAFTLVAFIGYLIMQILHYGNSGNCGCFGTAFVFTPLQGIIKNIALLTAALFIYIFHPNFSFRFMKPITIVLVIVAFVLPFILNPYDYDAALKNYSGELNYKIDLDNLYNNPEVPSPKAELRNGKWIIAFMSLTCPHCRIAAKKLHIMKLRNPNLPIYIFLNGRDENIKPFFEDTRAENLPWSQLNGHGLFFKLAGPAVPQIDWVNNSVVENKSNYMVLQQDDIEAWLKK
jgi:methylamine utilization protein MauE